MDIRLGQIQPRRSRAKMRQFSARASTPRGSREKQPRYHLRCSVASAAIKINPTTPRVMAASRSATLYPVNVRFTPNSGHVQRTSPCLLWAKSRHCTVHSITSSAIDITPDGMVRSSALAVLRLIRNSYLVACTTGRSAGFSPLRIRPM
jgi:hypothetical protein